MVTIINLLHKLYFSIFGTQNTKLGSSKVEQKSLLCFWFLPLPALPSNVFEFLFYFSLYYFPAVQKNK